jgi:superfamily I DNA/RNA helicase
MAANLVFNKHRVVLTCVGFSRRLYWVLIVEFADIEHLQIEIVLLTCARLVHPNWTNTEFRVPVLG